MGTVWPAGAMRPCRAEVTGPANPPTTSRVCGSTTAAPPKVTYTSLRVRFCQQAGAPSRVPGPDLSGAFQFDRHPVRHGQFEEVPGLGRAEPVPRLATWRVGERPDVQVHFVPEVTAQLLADLDQQRQLDELLVSHER